MKLSLDSSAVERGAGAGGARAWRGGGVILVVATVTPSALHGVLGAHVT